MLTSWKESYDQPRQHIKKQRQYFANKGPSSKGYGFSSGHVWMWELDCKESWEPKNWCFWTVVLEKTLESPLDCKEIQPVHSKGDQSWVFIGRTDVEAETLIFWPPDAKSWLIWKDRDAGKDWRQEEKGTMEDEMVGWHHQLNGHGFGGVGDGQGGLACCSSWGCNKSDTTEQLNWTEPLRKRSYSFFKKWKWNFLSCVQLFATPWTAARQASLSITNSQSLLKLMSIESVMPFNHLIFCRPLLFPPSIFPSIRVFFSESVLRIR